MNSKMRSFRLYLQIFAFLLFTLFPGTLTAQRGSYAHVAAGDDFGMVVKKDGTLWAFGKNGSGQLGDGTTSNRNTPVQVLSNVESVSCGNWHTMALLNDGTLYA